MAEKPAQNGGQKIKVCKFDADFILLQLKTFENVANSYSPTGCQ